MTVADDLRAGATYIREHGHAKGTAQAFDGSVCAMGGIALGIGADLLICYGRTATTSPDVCLRFGDALVTLNNYLLDNKLTRCHSIADWNDITFSDDVIASMEKAAAWSEEQA